MDNSLVGTAGMTRKINRYSASNPTKKLAMGAGNTKSLEVNYDPVSYTHLAIVTGYAPFGNMRPSYELRKRYETGAEKIREYYSFDYEKCKARLRGAMREFSEEVTRHE